jgi:hypothetical protein
MFCSDGFRADGQVRLLGARIGGVLSFTAAELVRPGRYAIDGQRLEVRENLLAEHDLHVDGGILLSGVADLTVELRAWPTDTWAKVGVDPDQVAQAVVGCWQKGEVTGLQVDDLSFEEARSLTRPAMTYLRGQLRGRLTARLARAHRRWLHPTSGRRPGDRFP